MYNNESVTVYETLDGKRLKNGTPHSRYFSDELGVPIILIDTEQMFALQRDAWYNINVNIVYYLRKKNYFRSRRNAYFLQYHFAQCAKYRKQKAGTFMQIVSSYGVEIKKKNITAPLYAGYFSESSFLSDSGVCRDLGRTFRNQKSTKTL